jgi:hypothetical protein
VLKELKEVQGERQRGVEFFLFHLHFSFLLFFFVFSSVLLIQKGIKLSLR